MKSVISEWRKYRDRYGVVEGGEILSFSKVLVAPERFQEQVPYYVALIQLHSGQIITSQVVDSADTAVVIGAKVEPVVRKISNDGVEQAIAYGTKFRVVS